jgi:hypothetical protein
VGLVIGRLALDDPEAFPEAVGEPIARVGATPVPGGRQGLSVSAGLTSFPAAAGDTAADRQRVRRQLRALLNNLTARAQGLYVAWSEDPEQDGWYVPGGATFDVAGEGALASAFWRFTGLELALLGRPRTHRRAIEVHLRDRRLATTPRDTLKRIYDTGFGTLSALQLAWLPSSVSDVVTDYIPPPFGLPIAITGSRPGHGGALLRALIGPAPPNTLDLAVASFEQAAADRNRGDVVLYDRRGVITAPSGGPDPAWEEVYGPDQPLTAGDVPVLDNALTRIRWSSANTPGFAIDVWTGSVWTETGKVIIERLGATQGFCDTLVSAAVVEWAPDRAVVRVVLRRAADASSREEVYLTLQRGWRGPRIEVYPALRADGTAAGATIVVAISTVPPNTSVCKIDASGAGVNVSTAGTGSALFSASYGTGANVGAATFTGENLACLLRQGESFALTLAVLQSAASLWRAGATEPYGTARNVIGPYLSSAGYMSAQIGVHSAMTDQVMEAESMTAASGTSSTSDANASGGTTTQATRTSEADHVTRATWPNSARGRYRVFARVRTSAGGTLSIRAQTGATTGSVRTTTSTSYVWLDLGDITANATTLQIRAWISSGTLFVDRIEAHKLEDRTDPTAPVYDGARDLAQEVLFDSRSPQTIVSR